jgi:hypothetical protein
VRLSQWIFRAEAGEKHQVLLLLQKNFIKRSTDLQNAVQTWKTQYMYRLASLLKC